MQHVCFVYWHFWSAESAVAIEINCVDSSFDFKIVSEPAKNANLPFLRTRALGERKNKYQISEWYLHDQKVITMKH